MSRSSRECRTFIRNGRIVTMRNGRLKKMYLLIRVALFASVVWIAQSEPGHYVRAQQTPSTDFGRPVSLETGNEQYPLRKGFLSCADQQLHPEFRHGHTDELFDNLNKQS